MASFLDYESLNYEQLSSMNRQQTVVFIPCGPLEQHGPHLPLGMDGFSARYFSEQAIERLAQGKLKSWNFIIYPTLFLGSDVLSHLGSIEVRPRTLRAALLGIVAGLAKNGFKNLVLVGAHGGPRHMVVLEEVASRARWRWGARAVSASARILPSMLKGELTDKIVERMISHGVTVSEQEKAALKKDFHGGLLETSILMKAKPSLVGAVYKKLEPAVLDSIWKLRKNSGKKVTPGLGYLGYPALARPEFATSTVEVLLDDMVPLLESYCSGERVEKKFRSFLYYIPFFRTDFFLVITLFIYAVVFLALVRWSSRVISGF